MEKEILEDESTPSFRTESSMSLYPSKDSLKFKILQKCQKQYHLDLTSDEWEPIIDNNSEIKTYLKTYPSASEVELYYEIKFPNIDFNNLWKCFHS